MRNTPDPIKLFPSPRLKAAQANATPGAPPPAPGFSEIAAAIDAVNRTFAEFREANDRRLAEIEKRGTADPVSAEKVENINAEVGRLDRQLREMNEQIAAASVGVGASNGGGDANVRAYNDAFYKWMRTGDDAVKASLPGLAIKAGLSTDSNPDGGYLIPAPMEDAITRAQGTRSVMRQLATVVSVGGGGLEGLHNLGGAASGWVGEKSSRAQTATPQLVKLKMPMGEIYAMPAATRRMLEDARVDLAAWLAGEVDVTFTEQEGDAFINGDGVEKPHGLLSQTFAAAPTTSTGTSAWDAVNFTKSGSTTTVGTGDEIIAMVHTLKAGYRQNASFLMNDLTLAAVRKLKDGDGNYLWQPSYQAGVPSQLLSYGVNSDDNMPDIGSNAYPIAFGDWKRAYYILDRMGSTLLQDPYTAKPNVLFYITKRVGGGVRDHKAYKVLKCAT